MKVIIKKQSVGRLLIGAAVLLILVTAIAKSDVDKQQAFLCDLTHSQGIPAEECPVHNSIFSWTVAGMFVIGFLVLAAGFYLSFPQGGQEEAKFKTVDTGKLDGIERKIYDTLLKSNGSVHQADLVRETGLSKVRVTRILDKMEFSGVLERRRRGMSNIVVLK
ncbi:MAG: winged helix-turn-helix transcriptional regulator [Candidatus Aenigmarchaeota archaeon]|nr:winged helix-turn-helix transcriptional regulator [Candidatus Aenigmarchaeota archaeon]